ncbi:MAG TPA: septal ring lytic transglycosylase RlpA family protein [Nitrospira sp.]|nr:septal ring lytic transglycosylase RlpA family protein [Nitrospira sp.]
MRPSPPFRLARNLLGSVLLLAGLTLQSCSTGPPHVDRFPGYPIGFVERGVASWYGPGFHGNATANGERYDMHGLTAAHRTLPLGSIAVVHSLTSGRRVTVRINDRGPFARGRVLDLSLAGAQALGMTGNGTDQVELRVVGYSPRPEGMGVLRVQIGAFAELQNARALFEQVRGESGGGRITQVDLPEGRRYRVQMGRFLGEAEANAAAARLDRKFNLQSFVIRDDG